MPFWQPISFFFSQPTNFLFQDFASYLFSNVSLLSFIYHVHPRATAQVEEPREDRAGVFEQQRTIGDTPSFFFCLVCFFFWISKCHYGSRGERDYFLAVGEQRREVYTYFTHKACSFFLIVCITIIICWGRKLFTTAPYTYYLVFKPCFLVSYLPPSPPLEDREVLERGRRRVWQLGERGKKEAAKDYAVLR